MIHKQHPNERKTICGIDYDSVVDLGQFVQDQLAGHWRKVTCKNCLKNESKGIALKSANLCLDGAIKKLKNGESPNSYLFQFCMQFKRYCKLESEAHKKITTLVKTRCVELSIKLIFAIHTKIKKDRLIRVLSLHYRT